MTTDSTERPCWTRREFVRTGIATVGTLAFGAWGPRGNLYGSLATESSADPDALAGRGIGGMLMGLSNGVASRVGMTDTAYPLRGPGLSSLLHAEWNRPQDREAAIQWVAEHGAALRPWAQRAYVNYLPPSAPDRTREVYGVNYSRLARIKAQYDPANLFRSNQNILPGAGS